MRIKITKTMDDNQVPAEVRRMLDQCKNTLMYTMPDQMSAIVRASLSTEAVEFFSTIEQIKNFRQQLAFLDEGLSEVENLLMEYKDVLMPPSELDNHDEEWHKNEQAEYEKFMSQVAGSEEGFDEEG